MKVLKIENAKPKQIHFKREKEIYALIEALPEILEKDSLFRPLCINKGPEKGPDFLAINKMGHLLIGEVKNNSFRADGWKQAKRYANEFSKMRESDLNEYLQKMGFSLGIREIIKGFLGFTAKRALLNPSRRKIQIILVAEKFSDKLLNMACHEKLGKYLKLKVKDVKCITVSMFNVPQASKFAIAAVISGKRRKLRK